MTLNLKVSTSERKKFSDRLGNVDTKVQIGVAIHVANFVSLIF